MPIFSLPQYQRSQKYVGVHRGAYGVSAIFGFSGLGLVPSLGLTVYIRRTPPVIVV